MSRNRDVLGIPAPALEAKPEIFPDLLEIYYAFQILNFSRDHTDMGAPKPIKLGDMKLIYDEFDLCPLLTFRTFIGWVMSMASVVDSLKMEKTNNDRHRRTRNQN